MLECLIDIDCSSENPVLFHSVFIPVTRCVLLSIKEENDLLTVTEEMVTVEITEGSDTQGVSILDSSKGFHPNGGE